MKAHLDPQCRISGIATLVLLVAALASGCANQGPQVKVLGVTQPRQPVAEQRVVVFVEVVNPGQRELQLSRLEYQFQASKWLSSQGRVALARNIAPGASAIVEIPVPVEKVAEGTGKDGLGFTLQGRLFAQDDQLERSWSVKAKGALRRAGNAAPTVDVQVAAVR